MGVTAGRFGPASRRGAGGDAAWDIVDRSSSGGARGVRMSAAHRGAVTTLATVAVSPATSDIRDNSSSSNTEEYECNER